MVHRRMPWITRPRAYRVARRTVGHGSPVATPPGRAACAGSPIAGSCAPHREPDRSEHLFQRPKLAGILMGGGHLEDDDSNCHGRAEERVGSRSAAGFAQVDINWVSVAVDGAVQLLPPPTDLQVRLIHGPAVTGLAPPALPQSNGEQRRATAPIWPPSCAPPGARRPSSTAAEIPRDRARSA